MTQTIQVKIPAPEPAEYPIYIQQGILPDLWDRLDASYPKLRKFIVTDSDLVKAGHLKTLAANYPHTYIVDPPGEVSKHIETVIKIVEQMERDFFGRDSMIVALGGGTVGDMAGFAAAIFKRGIKVIQIPTTTVAQADSAVGGKTGVDSSISKNAFGAFWQPEAVYIDVNTLMTLDDLQYRAGLVESVKHAMIADAEYFAFFEANMPALLDREAKILEHLAVCNCRIKADVVMEDPTEKNKRRILNYGHTLGHAVESASRFALLHGQAVAIGIVAAGMIEKKMGLANDDRLDRIKKMLTQLDMPQVIGAEISKSDIVDLLKRDKKAVGQRPPFVLLDRIGSVYCKQGQWAHPVEPEIVDAVIDELK